MGTTWPKQVLDLPVDAARQVFEFAYHPAAYIHPERAHQAVPALMQKAGLSASHLSVGLLDLEAISPWNGLDWSSMHHRPALLPFEGLQVLAWRLGLASMALRLRLVIARTEWLALSEFLSPADWQWVDEWPQAMGIKHLSQPLNWLPVDALDALPISAWPALLQQWGWGVVEAASGSMPANIGERLRLKLPVRDDTLKLPASTLALTALVAAYPGAVAQWNTAWDAAWVTEVQTAQ